MSTYVLEYADGQVTEIVADIDEQAVAAALARFGADAVACDQWDADGHNDDGEPMRRLLIWECPEDSEDDPGAKSVAQISAVGSP